MNQYASHLTYSVAVIKFGVNIVGIFDVDSCSVHIKNKCILQFNIMFDIKTFSMLVVSFILVETLVTGYNNVIFV